MRYHVVTLFPHALDSYLGESIVKRAIEDKKIQVLFYNPRDFADNVHDRIDRKPYGGGPGMVIQALPVIKAIEKALKAASKKVLGSKKVTPRAKIIFFSPRGVQFDTALAKMTAKKYTDIIFVCGRYEGIDARFKKAFKGIVDVSVGPYVLTGGELPAMILIDSISRQIPGVLGDIDSLEEGRVSSGEVYTRPDSFVYKGKKYATPKILLGGHHKQIEEWRKTH